MSRHVYHVGDTIGSWRLIYRGRPRGRTRWVAICQCLTIREGDLYWFKNGALQSCGCLKRDGLPVGYSQRPEYNVWASMKKRCHSPTHKSYSHYGGQNRLVCDRWRKSFAAFYQDMGPRPSAQHSLERRNNLEGYNPENCYWATITQQMRNTSTNHLITYQGETLPVVAWAERLAVPPARLYSRLRSGWSDEQTITMPTLRSGEAARRLRRPFPRRTHCPNGHAYAEVGFRVLQGKRHCLVCRRAAQRRGDLKRRPRRKGVRHAV